MAADGFQLPFTPEVEPAEPFAIGLTVSNVGKDATLETGLVINVPDFIAQHDQVFVVEQNRDAQMLKLIVNECAIDPARFISILHYDGAPVTARFIIQAIAERMTVIRKEAAE